MRMYIWTVSFKTFVSKQLLLYYIINTDICKNYDIIEKKACSLTDSLLESVLQLKMAMLWSELVLSQ